MKNVIITGGLGYIGSHTASLLAEKNIKFLIIDNLSNCKIGVIKRLEKIIKQKICFIEADIRDTNKLKAIFQKNEISSILHFAALKSVEDSMSSPIEYYETNISGTISVLNAMKTANVRNLVFSSSATVYGEPNYLPINEFHKIEPINPYGQSKIIVEKILYDLAQNDDSWSINSLRYFNPVGSHLSNLIGDDPISNKSKNLMPNILDVVKGLRKEIKIFGRDYDTPDGTCIRDYIHIMDLANAHYKSLKFLEKSKGFNVFNIGTGIGYSVLELINTFEDVTGLEVPKSFVKRREGDVQACYADPTKARDILGWNSKYDLRQMCLSSFEFSKSNV
tara:strand:- start:1071 stop:2075 length:1005 start_codon:yes stop_codon:yes gene_type:complete